MAGFVVCASCGTQIKAGRAYCLRCGEDLPVEGAPVKISVWESLELSQGKLLMLLAVVALIVLALVLVIWQTQPLPVDDVAQPVNVPAAPPPVVPPPAAETAAPTEWNGTAKAVPYTLRYVGRGFSRAAGANGLKAHLEALAAALPLAPVRRRSTQKPLNPHGSTLRQAQGSP